MQATRQHLLASATFAQQHDGGVAAGYFFDGATHAQHARVTRHQARQCVRLLHRLQTFVFSLQFSQPERPLHRQVEQLGLERFGKKIVGPQGYCAQGVGPVVLAGEHNHLGVRVQRQNLLEQLEALRHRVRVGRQAEVHGDHGWQMAAHLHQCALAVVGGNRLEAVKRPLDLLLQRQIVFDDQQCPCLL